MPLSLRLLIIEHRRDSFVGEGIVGANGDAFRWGSKRAPS